MKTIFFCSIQHFADFSMSAQNASMELDKQKSLTRKFIIPDPQIYIICATGELVWYMNKHKQCSLQCNANAFSNKHDAVSF